MKNLNIKATILINFCRCFFAATFFSGLILLLMQINLIKVSNPIDLVFCFKTLCISLIVFASLTTIGAFLNAIPIILYVIFLPGYVLADVMLYFLIKANPIGYEYPIYTFRVYIPFAKE